MPRTLARQRLRCLESPAYKKRTRSVPLPSGAGRCGGPVHPSSVEVIGAAADSEGDDEAASGGGGGGGGAARGVRMPCHAGGSAPVEDAEVAQLRELGRERPGQRAALQPELLKEGHERHDREWQAARDRGAVEAAQRERADGGQLLEAAAARVEEAARHREVGQKVNRQVDVYTSSPHSSWSSSSTSCGKARPARRNMPAQGDVVKRAPLAPNESQRTASAALSPQELQGPAPAGVEKSLLADVSSVY
ncbi:hypothetical protein TSOC_005942 [Tetrabaena socialis]|uniref:Uncharacterized protein n=1 Tax=Tetrabaena socialis TaxID=47790 RepID=A0A2J8A504_9CHLO|nr:hypothetical protein TSOC_005942 [Tetrabaena socialis]|eukprot:PNH07601.1 hypothetical protein TSOC_005942 [Tetrabaena socialis]